MTRALTLSNLIHITLNWTRRLPWCWWWGCGAWSGVEWSCAPASGPVLLPRRRRGAAGGASQRAGALCWTPVLFTAGPGPTGATVLLPASCTEWTPYTGRGRASLTDRGEERRITRKSTAKEVKLVQRCRSSCFRAVAHKLPSTIQAKQ